MVSMARVPSLDPNRDDDRPVYRWTTRDDQLDERAIIVGILGTSSDMIAAGLSYVEPAADIYWHSMVTPCGFFEASGEIGHTVPTALKRAGELCHEMGYDRVVIRIEEKGMWRPEWGRLAEQEGFN